jgi:hypothetical protein
MAPKIVRDIGKKGSFVISIKDEDLSSRPKKAKFMLDISEAGKQQFVITKKEKAEKKPEQVFFLHIDAEKRFKFDRINETIRVAAAGTLILFVLNIINVYQRGIVIKNSVIASAFSGYEDLLAGGEKAKSSDFEAAAGSFNEANKKFSDAINDISFLQTNRDTFFAREKTVDSVQSLLKAAQSISSAGQDFARGIQNLSQLPALFIQSNAQAASGGAASGAAGTTAAGQKSLTDKLKEDLIYIQKATDEIKFAANELQFVSADVLPEPMKGKLAAARENVSRLITLLDDTQSKIPAVLALLGDRYPHTYLVLLQNDTEARPTGGFIGSYMLVDMNDGYITKMEFHDVYDADGQLKEEIPAPEEIAKISKNWRLRDSNYSPDFAISGEKAAWFLQKEKGPSVDTVIAVNQSFLADLLAITGPIAVEGLNSKLDKDNYQTVLSYIIESKINPEEPKKILAEFISSFQKKLFISENLQKTLKAFIAGYKKKSLLFYSRNDDAQALFEQLGMSGKVISPQAGTDYLSVITTSIGGNKSDLFINQTVQHNTVVNSTGLLTNEVTITRKNEWSQQSVEYLKAVLKPFGYSDISDTVKSIMGGGVNKSYVKIYVPKGSKLMDTDGIDAAQVQTKADEETGRTYFMFEQDVTPGDEKKVTVIYQLPENLTLTPVDTYRFQAQMQPGARQGSLVKQIFLKPGLQSYKQYPEGLKKYESGNLYYESKFDKDIYLSAVVGN